MECMTLFAKKKKMNLDFFFLNAGLVTLVLTDTQNNIPII